MAMIKCEKCGVEIEEKDAYETKGQKVCEDCSIQINSYNSPKKNCAQ